jgi:hypothetical protein
MHLEGDAAAACAGPQTMDSGSVLAATGALQQAGTDNAVQLQMLRRSLDLQQSSLAQLIDAVPRNPPLAATGSVGTRVNTAA